MYPRLEHLVANSEVLRLCQHNAIIVEITLKYNLYINNVLMLAYVTKVKPQSVLPKITKSA